MKLNTDRCPLDRPNASFCRRRQARARFIPSRVTCWSAASPPRPATLVEADTHGARLVLAFPARLGEMLRVSFTDALGMHQTRRARVAWTHRLECANRLMVGLAFEQQMAVA